MWHAVSISPTLCLLARLGVEPVPTFPPARLVVRLLVMPLARVRVRDHVRVSELVRGRVRARELVRGRVRARACARVRVRVRVRRACGASACGGACSSAGVRGRVRVRVRARHACGAHARVIIRMRVCACARAHVCARGRLRVCARARLCAHISSSEHACNRIGAKWHERHPHQFILQKGTKFTMFYARKSGVSGLRPPLYSGGRN